ncbi:WD repeat-containing protein 6 isoform X2 [Astyanax mexicanus]|nr:WD repeat-containing protein 6 isoform X2 [Astyanax mexicanus]XP_049341556.1 WD repeat-containing protein 6 isoform X2 [Astyanax mexicanus]XP_049341557.1 WD repeat-containing protein 6 isoform X2 [Astyanax mexicanus]
MTSAESCTVLESCALVAPVTALEFLRDDYLLTGQGPILTLFSLEGSPRLRASQNVLQNFRIHGIRPKPQTCHDAHDAKPNPDQPTSDEITELAIFGGKGLRLINVSPCGRGLEVAGPLMELQDWVLDVSWLMDEPCPLLGVSIAHNAAILLEPQSGKVLSLCSCAEACLLYSALLIGQSWEESVLVGGTVFNQLVLWRPGRTGTGRQCQAGTQACALTDAQVERRLLGHSGVIFSLFYLQSSGWLASASDDRSVRLWHVGELSGSGGCGVEVPTCLRVLYGHQARVFCVRLSPGWVFSAGEDGACLLWEWEGEGRVGRTLKSHRSGGIRSLAVSNASVGKRSRWVATGGADGGVRLWKVVEQSTNSELKVEVEKEDSQMDLGFEGIGCPKVVRSVGGGHTVVTCTDQGQVSMRQDGSWKEIWHGGPDFQSYCVMEVVCIQGVWVCAVGNLNGGVQVFPLRQPGGGTFLQASEGKIHSLQWVERRKGACSRGSWCLLASGSEGLVQRWTVEVAENEETGLFLVLRKMTPFLLPPCAKQWLTAAVTVTIHSGKKKVLWVCGDRRGSLLLYKDEKEKSQRESVQEEDTQERVVGINAPIPPVATLFGVHGKQGVTSVCERRGVCYSTGRDGCVRVLALNKDSLNVRRVHHACKGMDWLEKVLFLDCNQGETWKDGNVDDENEKEHEEEEVEEREDRTSERALENGQVDRNVEERDEGDSEKGTFFEARFLMAGFHSVEFVLWDPIRQEKVFTAACGGGHRSWAYIPSSGDQTLEQGTLIFIKQGTIMASRSLASSTTEIRGHTLREGLHGRGLACVCRLGELSKPGDSSEKWEVLVTGGEDTTVNVLAVRPDQGTVKVLAVIADHISNIRTLAAVPRGAKGDETNGRCRDMSFSTLVFSAGGRAQLQCYRLLIGWDEQTNLPTCQVTQIAGHRLDEKWERRRNRHKTVKMDPETRYMSMAVVQDGVEEVLLALACSDGAVRIFSVGEDSRKVELLWESFYHQRCVLSVASYSLEDIYGKQHVLLLSGATDGAVALWDLTAVLDSKSGDSWLGPSVPCLSVPVHQSGVNALVISKQRHQQTPDDIITMATGGDDGQLSVMKIKVEMNQSDQTESLCPQLLSHWSVPLAHSAPLTALTTLSSARWASASPDQRVCVWRLCDDGLHHQGAMFTHTADAAGVWAWQREEPNIEGGAYVVVCGQGLQLLKLMERRREEEEKEEEKEGKETDRLRTKEIERRKVVFGDRNKQKM